MNFLSVTIQVKAIEHLFPTLMFIIIYKFVLALESMRKILPSSYKQYSVALIRHLQQVFPCSSFA